MFVTNPARFTYFARPFPWSRFAPSLLSFSSYGPFPDSTPELSRQLPFRECFTIVGHKHPAMNTYAKKGVGVSAVFQALTGVSTGAVWSTKLRPRRSGPNATAIARMTMVQISNPASAQL
jgi:hypothetical protein